MPVIFDEVQAEVEATPSEQHEKSSDQQAKQDLNPRQIETFWQQQQRRAQRVFAD